MSQIEEVRDISKKLSLINSMNLIDEDTGEPFYWTTSLNLIEAADSFQLIREDLIPRLKHIDSSQEASDLVHQIGEELRHVFYHIDRLKYFSYLK